MPVTRPTSLSEQEASEVVDILVEAFWPDVAMQAMAAFDTGVLRFMMSKRLEAALKIQTALIYRDDTKAEGRDGEVVGILTINPPGLDHSEVRKSYATDQPFMDHIAQDVKDWLNNELDLNPNQADVKYYAWFGRWSTSVFGPTGLGDSLYINLVAVRSDQRRKGIGKQLMRAALEQAEKEGVPVTLLSHEESNTAYYESLGFKTRGYATLQIKGQETRWWGMQRDK